MSIALGTCIHYEKAARSDDLMMAVIVQSLAVLRKNCGERRSPALRICDAFHAAYDLLFQHSRLTSATCLCMHPVTDFSGLVHLLYLALLLDQTQSNYSLHQFLRGAARGCRSHLADSRIRNTGELCQLHLIVIPCRRKEMYGTSCRYCCSYCLVELSQRQSLRATYRFAF